MSGPRSLRSLGPRGHSVLWHLVMGSLVWLSLLAAVLWKAVRTQAPEAAVVGGLFVLSTLLLAGALVFWRRHLFLAGDLRQLLESRGATNWRRSRPAWRGARLGERWVWVRLDQPWMEHAPRYLRRLDRFLGRLLPGVEPDRSEGGAGRAPFDGGAEAHVVQVGDYHRLAGLRARLLRAPGSSGAEVDLRRGDPGDAVIRALERVAGTIGRAGVVFEVVADRHALAVRVDGSTWLGAELGGRIVDALELAGRLVEELSGVSTPQDPTHWNIEPTRGGIKVRHQDGKRCAGPGRLTLLAGSGALVLASLMLPIRELHAGVEEGTAFLVTSQEADGGWTSTEVRRSHATSEALRALQSVGGDPVVRAAAADLLELEAPLDHDERARRIGPLAGEGRDVSGLAQGLVDCAAPRGGWGLVPDFTADPLDTALALDALAGVSGTPEAVLQAGLSSLVASQRSDGGWPCVDSGDGDAESEIFCTAHAVRALVPYRGRFFLDPAIQGGVDFLAARLQADGSFGPAGPNVVVHTALASLALGSAGALGPEVPLVTAALEGLQIADGSWDGDPFPTALAVRALDALSRVPFCGDGLVNQDGEICDGSDLAGATCGGLGLGTGTLSCTDSCTLETSGCSGPPVCGDGEINQDSEACDGTDLGGQTCEGLGLGPGELACADSCTFDTSGCSEPPTCGDGVINQDSESCDGTDLGGTTCEDLGFLGGTLACGSECTFDASSCEGVPFCGDGEINQDAEECDGSDLGGQTCSDLGLGGGTLGCSSECTVVTAGCDRSGAVDPSEIVLEPSSPVCAGGSEVEPVDITFPAGSVIDRVDVFLLFDDTGSFAGRVPSVTSIFSQLVDQLRAELPEISFGFGVGRFEDYGGPGTSFSREFSSGRPFTLNQPIITPEVPAFLTLINGALSRRAPGFGGDGPETNYDALYQIATGVGFDGNGNGSTLDSGPAGDPSTQSSPGSSGDVPAFASNVAPTSGELGGVGFRPGALHLVLMAGDICAVAPYTAGEPVPTTITGAGGATVPASAFQCSSFVGSSRFGFVSDALSRFGNTVSGAVAPRGAATVPETIEALNALGISVIGLAPGGFSIRNPVGPSFNESVLMSATALLTGAVDETGNPLVFNISGGAGPIRDAIVDAVTTAATRPRDVTLTFRDLPAGLSASFTPQVVPGVGPGESATFEVTFSGDGSVVSGEGFLDVVDQVSNGVLATVPVRAECLPIADGGEDDDGDGFPDDVDCDDGDPSVNPGADEVPGNGVDDDCNPATPDSPPEQVACSLVADRIAYPPTGTASLEAALVNLDETFVLSGLDARLAVTGPLGDPVFGEERALAPLPPGGRLPVGFEVELLGRAAGEYSALLELRAGGDVLTGCSAAFRVESTALSGAGLVGTLILDPDLVNAGDPSDAFYTVTNEGNDTLQDLGLRVLLVDPDGEQVLAELTDVTTLAPGETFDATQVLSTVGLSPKGYLAVLLAKVAGTDIEQTLDSDGLLVVNEPPDCSAAAATPEELWPPNHRFVGVTIDGVIDPDGDPVTLTVTAIEQDEPVDDGGDGAFCPDGEGTGTAVARLRAERSGGGDGRVYHVGFVADDGRGGTCETTVTVCVPHDRRGETCIDQGPLFESGVCP